MDTQRTCYLCDRVLPVASFTRRSNGTSFSACKDCNRHVFAQRRRARLAGSGGTYATEEWDRLLEQYERCPGCLRRWADIPPLASGVVVTVDHIVPISLGGANSVENLQPLCYSCNSRKGARPTSQR
jgi:5-methylcytosine-specific restriction endonuclease McrA